MAHSSDLETALAALRRDADDPSAWAALYRCLARLSRAYLYRLAERRADVREEITQDALVRFVSYSPWRKDWTQLPSAGQVVRYLQEALRSALHARWKKEGAEAAVLGSQATMDPDRIGKDDVEDDERLLRRISRDLTQDELELLALKQEGQSLSQIADTLGINYTAAGGRIHRLKKKIVELMKKRC